MNIASHYLKCVVLWPRLDRLCGAERVNKLQNYLSLVLDSQNKDMLEIRTPQKGGRIE